MSDTNDKLEPHYLVFSASIRSSQLNTSDGIVVDQCRSRLLLIVYVNSGSCDGINKYLTIVKNAVCYVGLVVCESNVILFMRSTIL